MKHLKTFEKMVIGDSIWKKLDDLVSNLKDISYVVEDEGFEVKIDVISDCDINITLISKKYYDMINSYHEFNFGEYKNVSFVADMSEVREYVDRIIGRLEDNNFNGRCTIQLGKNTGGQLYNNMNLFYIVATFGSYMRRGNCQLYDDKLKPIKESVDDERQVQKRILSEISCIRHIVEDSGFIMNINTDSPNFVGISIMRLLSQVSDITNDQDVDEFDKRLEEICLMNKYCCKKMKDTLKSGYVVWHCWDTTKMDRSAFSYED